MYTFESRVRFSEADHTELLTLPGLVNYFQDCSTFQSEDIGYGVESLKKSGQAGIHSGTDRILSGDRSWIYLFQKCDREDPGAGRVKIQSGVDPDPGVVHRCEAVACDV